MRLNATYDAGPVKFELLGSYRCQDWHLWSGSNAGAFADVAPRTARRSPTWRTSSGTRGRSRRSRTTTPDPMSASSGSHRPTTGRLVWSVGLFGFYEDQGAFLGQITGDPTAASTSSTCRRRSAKSIAAYGDANFKVTRRFPRARRAARHRGAQRSPGRPVDDRQQPAAGKVSACAPTRTRKGVLAGLDRAASRAATASGASAPKASTTRGWIATTTTCPALHCEPRNDRVNFFLDGIESFGAARPDGDRAVQRPAVGSSRPTQAGHAR